MINTLLSIGDTTFDTFIEPSESDSMCDLKKHEEFICFSFGDKIPAKSQEFSLGGNACNNAVGVKRLGVESAILTILGDDVIAEQTLSMLKKEGVEIDFVTRQQNSPSNYSTVINYGGERTIFTYRPERVYQFPRELPGFEWAYLTSMAEGFEKYYEEALLWVEKNNVKLAFNPGSRQIRSGAEVLSNVLSKTYMLYVNRSEAEKLTNFSNSQGQEKELLQRANQLGPKITIITDGPDGSYLFDGTDFYHCGVLPVDAYERTGAGDSFGSACLAALIKGKTIEEAMLWGVANSASVIGYVGAQKGLLKENEIASWIERINSSNIKVEKL